MLPRGLPGWRRDLVWRRAAENGSTLAGSFHCRDVPTVEATLEAYPAGVVVGPVAGLGQRQAGGEAGAAPAAAGDVAVRGAPRPGMEDHHLAVNVVQPGDRITRSVLAGIAATGQD